MSVLAATPANDSPYASVMTGLPSIVTLTMTARRWSSVIFWATMSRTCAASAVSPAVVAGASVGGGFRSGRGTGAERQGQDQGRGHRAPEHATWSSGAHAWPPVPPRTKVPRPVRS